MQIFGLSLNFDLVKLFIHGFYFLYVDGCNNRVMSRLVGRDSECEV